MNQKLRSVCGALTLACIVFWAAPARASAILLTLDCTITGPTTCPSGGPFGSILLMDSVSNPNNIDVTVTLTTGGLPENVNLNWLHPTVNPIPLTGWAATGGNIGANAITVSNNNTGPALRFDIRIADAGALYLNPLMFTLSNTTFGNLDVSFFNTKDDVAQLFGGVRQLDNQAYGALTSATIGPEASVPEPASLILLGTGLFGLGGAISRRRAARKAKQ